MNTIEKLFKTDKDAEQQGVEHYIGGGVTLRIARQNNPAYREYIAQLIRPYREEVEAKNLADDVWVELINKAMSKTILVGWDGIKDDNGNEIQYTPEKALDFLSQMPDFREVVSAFSTNMENYRVSELEKDIKN